jgi:hypothetical protein
MSMSKKRPSCADLEQWLKEKSYLSEGCHSFTVSRGRGWLRDGALTEGQREIFLQSLERPPIGSIVYKFGSRSFVGSCPIGDLQLALKYYYPLSLRRQLGYTILGTRCMRSWISSCALRFLGVATPEPLGVVELQRFGFLSHRSLFATEICEGTSLPDFLMTHAQDHEVMAVVAAHCREIFSVFEEYRVYHGDVTPKNFIVKPDYSVSVIDLDAMSILVHPRIWPTKRASDMQQFARVWEWYPDLKAVFANVFEPLENEEASP